MEAWTELADLAQRNGDIKTLFAQNPGRFAAFSARLDDMLLDFSKTSLDARALALLLEIAVQAKVAHKRDAMFSGAAINRTENRPVLHTALRNLDNRPVLVNGQDVMPAVNETFARLFAFAEGVRTGNITAADGKPFTDVVNIGIGGSDLGPVMVTAALAPYHDGPRTHFVANVDGAHLADTLRTLDPGAHPDHRRLENLYDDRDHDQCRLGAALDRRRILARRRCRRISPRSPPRSTKSPPSASRLSGFSASGTGWAAAIRSGRRSGCR